MTKRGVSGGSMLRTLLSRCAAMMRTKRLDADLDAELRAHIELATEENVAKGMGQTQARTTALRAFGGVTQTREAYRMRRGFPWLEQGWRDLRYAARQLLRAPGFALTATLTLALGLGANTAVFSLINGLLLRPLPVPHAEQLSILHLTNDSQLGYYLSAPILRTLERKHDGFDSMAGYSSDTMQVRGASGNVRVVGLLVSGQYFNVMQTAPLLGRTLTVEDDQLGAPNGYPVVLSEAFWRTWFNGAADVVGRKLTVANTPFTVVGVMPKSFTGADPTVQPGIYLPLAAEPIVDAPYNNFDSGSDSWWLVLVGRRSAGVSLAQVNAAMRAGTVPIVEASDSKNHNLLENARKGLVQMAAEDGSRGYTDLRATFQKPLVVVMSLCGVMLLLACLNLASLLMARAAARERELSTRLALGASRGRLVRQLLTESLMIAVLGTGAGLAVSPLVSHGLARLMLGTNTTASLDTSMDMRVFAYAAMMTAIAAVVIGLVPALRATSGSLNDKMKQGAQTAHAGRRKHWLPRALMASEVALALLLVTGAALLAVSLARLYRTGLGFEPKGVVNLDLDMDKQSLHGAALLNWYQAFANTLSHRPGVESVSYASMTPLTGAIQMSTYETPLSHGGQTLHQNEVAPGYFSTMRIPLLAGRDFRWTDTKGSAYEIVLNQSAAALMFPGQNAIGQLMHNKGRKDRTYEVVGVVGDVHYESVDRAAPPASYLAIPVMMTDKTSYTAVVRLLPAPGAANELAVQSRALVASMAPEIPAPGMTTMSSQLDASLNSQRMMAMLSVFFAGCALVVTAIGLYGTLAFATARRTREIGVRMALGAQRGQVVAMVFRENAGETLLGCFAGLITALLASRVLASFLYGTSVHDPWVMGGSVAVLALVAGCASLLPALRAATIEPTAALRIE